MPPSPSSAPKKPSKQLRRSRYGNLCFKAGEVQTFCWEEPISKEQAAAIAQQAEYIRAAILPRHELN
ncbi:MAG: hypothetical protein AAGF10_05345 [Verrucomicrobiota bacterium]